MKKLILCAMLSLGGLTASSQVLKIPLTDRQDDDSVKSGRTTTASKNLGSFKGIDSISFKRWSLQVFHFSRLQNNLNEELQRKVPLSSLLAHYKKYKIDTTYLTDKIIPENEIGVFVAFDQDNKKHLKVDANNNKDFSDDKEYILDTTLVNEKIPVKVKAAYFNGSSVAYFSWPLFINPKYRTIISSNGIVKDQTFTISFIDSFHKKGSVKIDGEKYLIAVVERHHNFYKNEVSDLYIERDDLEKERAANNLLKEYIRFSSKDSIQIGTHVYLVDSLTQNLLTLRKVKEAATAKGEVNTMAGEISGTELLGSQSYSLKAKRGKYVLIDFWGTWCMPCIQALPELVALTQKHKQLEVLSVAMDDQADLGKLKNMIADQKLAWNHLFVDRKGPLKVIKDYHVSAYPTTLLIDPAGKVVLRGIGANILKHIDEYLEKHLDK